MRSKEAGLRQVVAIHRPVAALASAPNVRRFYTKLAAALQNAGIATIALDDDGTGGADLTGHYLHICYHTHITAPNVINVKVGYLPEFFYFDDDGYSGWSAACGSAPHFTGETDAAIARRRSLVERYIERRVTRSRNRPILCLSTCRIMS
jgi:hypothetical protein